MARKQDNVDSPDRFSRVVFSWEVGCAWVRRQGVVDPPEGVVEYPKTVTVRS